MLVRTSDCAPMLRTNANLSPLKVNISQQVAA
jgi:hypothetical protein